jgi:enoyl-CoA hydratase/carnithine racemase
MKLTEFTYTKKTGDVSQRAVIVTSEPNKFLQGIDVSELDNDDLAQVVSKLRAIEDRVQAERAALMADYDLTYKFRQFDPALITEQTTEWV